MKFDTGEEGSGVSATGATFWQHLRHTTQETLRKRHYARDAEEVPLLAAKPQWRQIKEMRQGVLAAFVVREPLAYFRDLNL